MEAKEELGTISTIQNHCKTDREITQNLFCRICFQCDNESYIKPCRCTGNSEFVHDKCLSLWVLTKFPNIDNVKCEVCLEKFEFNTKRKCFFSKNIKKSSEYKKYRNIIIFWSIVLVLSIIILIGLKVYFAKIHKKNIENLAVGIICGIPILLSVFYIVISFWKLFFAYETTLNFKPFMKNLVPIGNSVEISTINVSDS